MRFMGPGVFDVQVVRDTDVPDDHWILQGDAPGVHVVENRISRVCESGCREGQVTVVLDPGVDLKVTSGRVPWVVGEPSRETLAMAHRGAHLGEKMGREHCRRLAAPRSLFRDRNDSSVVSIRLNDKCPHGAPTRVPQKCGHD